MYVCMYVCMYVVCMYVCICMYVYFSPTGRRGVIFEMELSVSRACILTPLPALPPPAPPTPLPPSACLTAVLYELWPSESVFVLLYQ